MHNACTVSRENTIFSLLIDQNRVPFDTHSKEKTCWFRFSGLPIYHYNNYYSVAQTALHQLYLSIFSCVGLWDEKLHLSIKCQRSLINKNSNVWGYTELDLQRVPELGHLEKPEARIRNRNGNRNRNRNRKRNRSRNRNGKRNLYINRDNIYLHLS